MRGSSVRSTVAVVVALTLGAPAGAHARDQAVKSFDGTTLSTSFFPAAGLKEGEKAPTVLQTHGWGLTRTTNAEAGSNEDTGQVGVGVLRRAGYNVLTWDSRGFGQSGGTVMVDSPGAEGRDVMALVDWVATQPEAQLDAAGDPRVGMQGPSYAGGIELVAAGLDPRIDVIAPDIAWHSLTTALNRDGLAKFGWGAALLGVGTPTSLTLGLFSPYGPETGTLPPELIRAAVDGAATGRFSDEVDAFLESRGPKDLVRRITIPTLLTQGTADTLFTPSEAMRNYEILRTARVPVKMVWFCGGHGICLTGNVPSVERSVVPWFARWLKRDASVDTGPRFEWVADDGQLRTAADFPLAAGPPLSAEGAGTVAITPVETLNGLLVAARPGLAGVRVPLPAVERDVDVVGEPEVSVTYSATGLGADDHVFGQLVDEARGVVVGNQSTPIPVVLDGKEHTVTRRLEGVAMRMTPGSRYRFELVGGSNVYGVTRGAAVVTVLKTRVVLPTVDAAATADRDALGLPPAGRCVSRRVFTIRLKAPRGQRLRSAQVFVGGKRVKVVRGRRLTARIDLRGLPKGTVRVKIVARTTAGRTVEQVRRYRTCTTRARPRAN
jgi:ABC-2 type transport system ATP-binding protein